MSSLHFLSVVLMIARLAGGANPASELAAAVADCETLSATSRGDVRYLSLYAVSLEDRERTRAVTSYVLNALSRARVIAVPRQVTDTLVRFAVTDYTANATERKEWLAAWEALAQVDPYWHLRTEVVPPGAKKTTVVTTDGGWVELPAAARLRALTGSVGALLRADWFITQGTQPPHYHAFAGIPELQSDWLKSLGVDQATIDKLRANAGANLVRSNVTQKPRRVIWQQGPLGGVYVTLDVESVTADRDFVRRPVSANGFQPTFDASEWFAVGPNGLWRVALYDGNGRRQDVVPDRIAKDTSDLHGDGRVVPLISCIRCHTESGLRPFRDDQTQLLAKGASLNAVDPQLLQRAAEFYQEPRLQRQMQFDRETYSAACREATGLTSEDAAAALAKCVREHGYFSVTLEQAARELGLTAAGFAAALPKTHDPILIALLQGRGVLRAQWEASLAEAALAARTRE